MNAAQILELVLSLATTLEPLAEKVFAAIRARTSMTTALAAERVEDILGATSRLELAEQAARLRAAHAAGETAALDPAARLLAAYVLQLHAALPGVGA